MKRIATLIVLSTGLAAGPVSAGQSGKDENVGGAIGAVGGAILGHSLGDGDARIATTAAGAIGGYLVGREVVRSNKTGPRVAHSRGGGRHYDRGHRGYDRHGRGRWDDDHEGRRHDGRGRWDDNHRGRRGPRLYPVKETFIARTTSNVRSGPSTRFNVVGRLRDHERVFVIGKVRGRDWFLVRDGRQRGFVYAPLLRKAHHGYRGGRRHGERHHRDGRRSWYR